MRRAVVALVLVLLAVPARAETASAAAQAVIATFSEAERAAAMADFASPDRRRSRYTPGPRGGAALRDMDAGTRAATWTFLETVLGAAGVDLVRVIVARERILGEIEGRPSYRDPDLYYLAFFGTPDVSVRWGFRFEGHHLSLNLTYDGDTVATATPFSVGANPERHDSDPPTVLTPLFELAGRVADGDEAAAAPFWREITTVLPTTFGRVYANHLGRRVPVEAFRRDGDGFRIDDRGIDVVMTGLARNHIHVTVSDAFADFGGASD